ncbi:MAG TPA: glucosaminidase domain-containing protein [Candidatus Paceibacterota bacterium]|nr:glucosaminidase domain-containing protein [Candidatus Paceibacterota bacterium]
MRRIIFLLLLSLISIIAPSGYLQNTPERKFQAEKMAYYISIRDLPFSPDLLKKVIQYEGILYPDVVLLQSQLETGFYTSDIFNNGKNLFGMKFPKYRPTVASGTYSGHAQYNHWIDSVIDYKIWQDWYITKGWRISIPADNAFYMVFLDCIKYAEDPHYIPKLINLASRDMT